MNNTYRGKIGHLPKALQEEVNRRLEQGENGRTVVAWLNVLPEVQAMLAAEFAGKPIREQNLSDWRKHGYKQWLWRQQTWDQWRAGSREPGAEGAPQGSTASQPVTDQMAGWVTAHYLVAIRKLVDKSAGGEPDLKTLRAFLQDVVAVRRGDHRVARLQLESERREDKRKSAAQDEQAMASDLSPISTLGWAQSLTSPRPPPPFGMAEREKTPDSPDLEGYDGTQAG